MPPITFGFNQLQEGLLHGVVDSAVLVVVEPAVLPPLPPEGAVPVTAPADKPAGPAAAPPPVAPVTTGLELAAATAEVGAPRALAVIENEACEPLGPSLATVAPIAVAAAAPLLDATTAAVSY